MTAPLPPARTSRTVAVVCGALAGLLAAVVLTVAAAGFYEWVTAPILPPVESRPMRASTAPPAPLTPVTLTAIPMHQRGPQALPAPEETR